MIPHEISFIAPLCITVAAVTGTNESGPVLISFSSVSLTYRARRLRQPEQPGYRGQENPPDSPTRPGRSSAGLEAGGAAARGTQSCGSDRLGLPRGTPRRARPLRFGRITPRRLGEAQQRSPSSGLHRTQLARLSVGRRYDSAIQDALAKPFLRPAGASGTTFLSHPFHSVPRDADRPCLRHQFSWSRRFVIGLTGPPSISPAPGRMPAI